MTITKANRSAKDVVGSPAFRFLDRAGHVPRRRHVVFMG